MKHIFIINQFSIGKKNYLEKKIINACEKLKLEYVIEKNDNKNSTEQIIEKYKKGKNIIIAIGGDGIINRVLNKIIGTNNILGFIPLGTGNDFYRSALEQFDDEINDCDITKINDKYFINVACFGIDADIANNKKIIKSKIIPKKLKYKLSLFNTFLNYECRNFKVYIDNTEIEDSFFSIAVCNGTYYGGGYKIGPNSMLNDKYIDIFLAPKLGLFKSIKLIKVMKNGLHAYTKYVQKYHTKKIILESNDIVNANIDGETISDKRFEIEVCPSPIKIYFNKELINEIIK